MRHGSYWGESRLGADIADANYPSRSRGGVSTKSAEGPSMFSTLRYCVFGSLYRPSPDDLPSRLRLKYCWLFCEWIDAAPLLCGGLLDNNEFGKSGHKEGS